MPEKTDERPKVAIIDDDADFLAALEFLLKPFYRVTALFGSAWTYTQVTAIEPDLILLDIHMPEQGGFDICRDLRADRRFARTPIIFLTASKLDEDFRRHLRAGGTRFLDKSVGRRRLVATIDEELAASDPSR